MRWGPRGIRSREEGWLWHREALSGCLGLRAPDQGLGRVMLYLVGRCWGNSRWRPPHRAPAPPPHLHSMQELICGFQLPSEKALCSAFFPGLCVAAPGLKGPCPTHVSGGSPERPRQRWLTLPELITQAGCRQAAWPTKASNAKQGLFVQQDKAAWWAGFSPRLGPSLTGEEGPFPHLPEWGTEAQGGKATGNTLLGAQSPDLRPSAGP